MILNEMSLIFLSSFNIYKKLVTKMKEGRVQPKLSLGVTRMSPGVRMYVCMYRSVSLPHGFGCFVFTRLVGYVVGYVVGQLVSQLLSLVQFSFDFSQLLYLCFNLFRLSDFHPSFPPPSCIRASVFLSLFVYFIPSFFFFPFLSMFVSSLSVAFVSLFI